MSEWLPCYPGDRALEFWLVVTFVVALVSSAAWFVSRWLARQAALRHLVLFCTLVCCLASPALAWFCTATSLSLASLPILCDVQVSREVVSGVEQILPDFRCAMPDADVTPLAIAPTLPETNPEIEQPLPAVSVPTAISQLTSSAESVVSWRRIVTGAMWVWALGTLLALVRLAGNCASVVQLRRASHLWESEPFRSWLAEIAVELGMRQPPLLLVSSRTVIPLAVGFGRPAVILPERLLLAVSADELWDVLVHEMAHLARGDQRIVLLQKLAGALYWPVVSVHALNRELQRAREEICDNVVLAGRDAIRYGETLLHVAELLVGARPPRVAVGIIGGRGELERRITGLIDPRRNLATKSSWRAAGIVMLMCLAGSGSAAATRFTAIAEAQASTAPIAGSDAAPEQEKDEKVPTDADVANAELAGRFSGQVLDAAGKPLAGARVYVIPREPENKKLGPVRAVTDADGRFEFDAPDMTYTKVDGLPARRAGYLIATSPGNILDWAETWGKAPFMEFRSSERRKATNVVLRLGREDVPIRGRFLGPDGKPLAGARVRISQLMVPKGENLDAHLEAEVKRSLFDSCEGSYDRELYTPPEISGLMIEAQTDAEGRFRLSGVGRDRVVELMVSAPSVINTTLRAMTRDAPDVRTRQGGGFGSKTDGPMIYGAEFTKKLEPGRSIRGFVRDISTKKPIAGMWIGVRLGPEMQKPLSPAAFPWVTDEQGRFTITGVYPGAKDVRVVAAAPPGVNYRTKSVKAKGDAEVMIECYGSIPFRLKVLDNEGKPVDADVTYVDLWPNAYSTGQRDEDDHWPVSRGRRISEEMYEGFVLPGPGAVLVKPQRSAEFRAALVDPKAKFIPGRIDMTAKEQFPLFGTTDTLTGRGPSGSFPQSDYAAIVLINPNPNSERLELSATVFRDHPRQVNLIDPEGEPVTGAVLGGETLRAASFPLIGLHPERVRRLKFLKEDQQLVGLLRARGDGDEPYNVTLQPWGTVTGRLVDEHGNALPIWQPVSDYLGPPKIWANIEGNPDAGDRLSVDADAQGRFRLERLVPGERYSARTYTGMWNVHSSPVFEELALSPGEIRDLGDVRTRLSYEPEYRRPPADAQEVTANIPAEAWGEPVNGLRVAIVLRSPPVDEKYVCLRYDVVAENVGSRTVRFSAGDHYEYGFCKVRLVGADGEELARQPGVLPNWADTMRALRYQLKPQERAVISTCSAKLVKPNAAGEFIPSANQNEYYHSFLVRPRRYAVSAAVELGTGIDRPDPKAEPRKLVFANEGEWTGTLQTGVVAVELFKDENQ